MIDTMQQIDIFHPALPKSADQPIHWSNLPGASMGLAISNAYITANRPMLIIAENSLMAAHLSDQIEFYLGRKEPLIEFPDWETLPYDHFSPHQDIISERLSALYRLPGLTSGIIITTIPTLLHRLPPCEFIESHHF